LRMFPRPLVLQRITTYVKREYCYSRQINRYYAIKCIPKVAFNYVFIKKRSFHTSNQLWDYLYVTLGVAKTATQEEIKRAYYQLAKKYHPDSPGNKSDPTAKDKFTAVAKAYEVLGDEKKRLSYDKYGTIFDGKLDPEELFNQFRSELGFDPFMENDEEDLIDYQRAENTEIPITLTLEESVKGTQKRLDYLAMTRCDVCNGTGASLGSLVNPCSTCSRLGYTKMGSGIFQTKEVCKHCKGYGSIIDTPCLKCLGRGTIEKIRRIKVEVPPGVDYDHRMRIKEKGHESDRNSGKPGDLYIAVKIEKHPQFIRKGSNIHLHYPITVAQAILGDTVKIPTLNGEVSVKVRPGTQHDTTHVLKKKGVSPIGSKKPGNQYVHWKVQIPTDLTPQDMELVAQFGEDEKIIPSKSFIKENIKKKGNYFTNK